MPLRRQRRPPLPPRREASSRDTNSEPVSNCAASETLARVTGNATRSQTCTPPPATGVTFDLPPDWVMVDGPELRG